MKIYFRADASIHIGTGHVMRCLSLAKELQRYGHDIVFVMRPQAGDLCVYTQNLGFKVIKLPKVSKPINLCSDGDYQAWLQVSESKDAKDFVSVASDADIVVVDHYGINCDWEKYVNSGISCKLVAVDDLVRQHDVDLIVDQTHGANPNEYKSNSAVKHVLAGSKYALLNTQFSEFHNLAVKKRITNSNHKLLLSMGGVDNPNATLKVLETLSLIKTEIDTTVLLSERAPHFKSVASFCKKNEEWVKHTPFSENMAELMLQHTIAIGAPGSTSWERACMGLPSILIPLAKNQLQICRNLVNAGCAISLSKEDIVDALKFGLEELLDNFDIMRSNSLDICDGMGCQRVVEKINELARS